MRSRSAREASHAISKLQPLLGTGSRRSTGLGILWWKIYASAPQAGSQRPKALVSVEEFRASAEGKWLVARIHPKLRWQLKASMRNSKSCSGRITRMVARPSAQTEKLRGCADVAWVGVVACREAAKRGVGRPSSKLSFFLGQQYRLTSLGFRSRSCNATQCQQLVRTTKGASGGVGME
jgi:hypothetical protein